MAAFGSEHWKNTSEGERGVKLGKLVFEQEGRQRMKLGEGKERFNQGRHSVAVQREHWKCPQLAVRREGSSPFVYKIQVACYSCRTH